MLKTLIVLPDGTALSSGTGTQNAIQSITITECVNDAQELSLGSVCANMIQARIITPQGGLAISAGDELEVYRVADDGQRYLVGLFTTEKPTRPSANSIAITAYDRVTWLDKDLSLWLHSLNAWPYSLFNFANMVCQECGLELVNESLINGDYEISAFSADGITGRQLMQWVGQIAGRFCRATTEGKIEFAWYQPVNTAKIGATQGSSAASYDGTGNLSIVLDEMVVQDDGEGNVTLKSERFAVTDDGQGNVQILVSDTIETFFYYQNGLSFEDYTVAPIEKVQLRQNDQDVGTVYPDGIADAVNTYAITGNYLLTASSGEELAPVAKILYEHMKDVTYTPCKVSIPTQLGIRAGNIVQITDRNGKTITAYVMTKTTKGQRDTLECTGSPNRSSSSAVNNQSFIAFTGKVLNLRTDVDGLKVENANMLGKLSDIELDIDGIRTTVQSQQEGLDGVKGAISSVQQSANELEVKFKKIDEDGATKVETSTGFTFSDEGLRISKSGKQMENLLDENGMHIMRNGEKMLTATSEGVQATDVTVRNYLIVGEHARFEDYGNGRTACYYWEVSS